ncbi:DUF881 domain-containing protein [Actinomadura sp. 6N118]|uniref:DUF881 domain-containing protein n=1 Tax=Actinomadura sp. 6N118 TaxID=3375151 RepID=UPI00378E3143
MHCVARFSRYATLDDARQQDCGRQVSPDGLVTHQTDGNALRTGGAAGTQIMDQRVISRNCMGNTLILQGVVCSPPFTITAVGHPRRLPGDDGAIGGDAQCGF